MTTSEWPPRYLVTLCITMSAPRDNGCCRAGVAKVLSTPRRAGWPFNTSATAAMSVMRMSGLVGVSSQTSRVRSFNAAATLATSWVSTKWNRMPKGT